MSILRSFPQMIRENTVLLTVDMQADFLDEKGPCPVPQGQQIIPGLRRLLDECRAMQMPVVHIGDGSSQEVRS